ncbi:MAG: hypothetical protein PWP23_1302 [Candidatus Sumerlaeota bacterium]|nr:hypothetical protein [Candidatus Sumerlaeota bacterium]
MSFKTILAACVVAVMLSGTGCAKRQAPAPAEASPNPFGIMGFQYSHAKPDPAALQEADAFMDLYLLTGSRWDRRDLWWGLVQPEPDRWEWDYFDAAVQDFRDANVNPVIILCYGSAWKQDAPATEEEIQQFGEYVYRMVDRYKDHVKHWEIWNEPNILPFWAPKPNVAHYTRLLQVSYERAKQADPDCVILGGALAGADERFVRGMYANGAKGYFDVLSYHTYGNDPTEARQRREIDILRRIMRENDDEKPLWITETGIYTGPAGVTEAQQAERMIRSEVLWVSHGVERVFQLTLKDWTGDENAADAKSFRGLVRADGSPKPSFWAHRLLSRQLGNAEFLGRWTPRPDVEGFLFARPDADVLVLWSDEEASDYQTPEGLPLDSAAVVEQRLARTADAGGMIISRLSTAPVANDTDGFGPVFLEGTGPALREVVRHTMRRADGEYLGVLDVVPGEVVPFPCATGGQTSALRFPEGAPIFWGRDQWLVKVPEGTPTGLLDVTGHIVIDGVEYPVSYRLNVLPPINARFPALSRTALPQGEVLLEVSNRTASQRTASVEFTFPHFAPITVPLGLPAQALATASAAVDWTTIQPGESFPISAKVRSNEAVTEASTTLLPIPVPFLETQPTIDGNLSEWKSRTPVLHPSWFTEVDFNPNRAGGAQDVSIEGWLGWDSEALYIAIEVTDDALIFPFSTVFWDYDSLQIALDVLNDAEEGETFDENDYEFEIARMRDGTNWLYPGHFPEGRIASIVEKECTIAIHADESAGRVSYELRIPAAVIDPAIMEPGRIMGFNVIHNDTDEDQPGAREGWIELTPGIGWGKEPWYFADLILWPKGVALPTP